MLSRRSPRTLLQRSRRAALNLDRLRRITTPAAGSGAAAGSGSARRRARPHDFSHVDDNCSQRHIDYICSYEAIPDGA
ncbi:hypothetical protein GLE_3372 [Lysobacter enzymogenes]|uniref:Uncharacterized protein n=1 Tax=Lysobacter enzymogenes TaxID=69 RepID=A0A0S2DJL5_LYSEN|nr:hypothetical protein GLE_3372 [Lysobacter enzymogenes]